MIVVERLRFRERWVDWLAAAAIVSVAFALAGLVWRIAGHADTGAITVPSEARARAVTVDSGPAIAWSPFGSPTAADATSPTGIQAILKGVVFARPAELSISFVSLGNEPAKPYKVGDALAGAQVTEIRRDRIILNNGGRLEYLAFPDPFGQATPTPGTAPRLRPDSRSPRPHPPPPPRRRHRRRRSSRASTPRRSRAAMPSAPTPRRACGRAMSSSRSTAPP
ncbi:type II secretion system protein N [Sphingomonas hankookensis]|uniref:type II secretion system protein N n=1 Tax=Sphingomonas hankookensis TaxID=563996 RepID=UPI00234F5019|nr:type II secretion system protein N [Sphingomonas hankookensis]WCP73087.1 type II secretion system protein N [Sphingomonas hankookensis]